MYTHDERESGENRSRRRMLATAGGLLLPTGLRAADGDEAVAKTTTRGKRQLPRPELRYWANDTIINVRNATDKTLGYEVYYPQYHPTRFYRNIQSGQETGFAFGIKPAYLVTDANVHTSIPGTTTSTTASGARTMRSARPM